MLFKDVLFAILLLFNMYFAYTIYESNNATQDSVVIEITEPDAGESDGINYHNYATLYMFKEIIPAEIFEESLLPEIKNALENGSMSATEWAKIQQKIKELENDEKIDFNDLYLDQIQKKDLTNSIESLFKSLGDEASSLSDSLKDNIEGFIDEHKDTFKKEEKHPTSQL